VNGGGSGGEPSAGAAGGSGLSSGGGAPSASAGAGGSISSSGGGGATSAGGNVDAWYEAEAVPPNVLTNGASKTTCNSGSQYNEPTCTHDQVKEGMTCCSEGGLVASLLGRAGTNNAGAGGELHDVSVPTDGTYAVTWWYHCGGSDTYGDTNCGGLNYKNLPSAIGCRPHLIDVNGVTVTAPASGGGTAQFYQFPCYSTAWAVINAATTALPLKAGNNTIYFHPPHVANRDSADIDAIHVTGTGQGTGPLVAPVVGNGED
jgi:hypothetical protein